MKLNFFILFIGFIFQLIFAFPFWPRDIFSNILAGSNIVAMNLEHLEETMFGNPSNQTGVKVAGWNEKYEVNPEELGEYAEGDILFPMSLSRNGLKGEVYKWPEGIIPFMLSPYFKPQQVKMIMDAMDEYHKQTCIRFIPYKGVQSDYIRITAGNSGCWSSVGRIGGRQDLNLQVPGCVTLKGTIIHELMHTVGFLHEQSRFERDNYVKINWGNIAKGRATNFEKVSKDTSDAFGVGYDYGSVMHYSSKAFSSNGKITIEPKGKTNVVLGQREGFSKRDVQKIRRMYKCSKRRRSYN